MSKKTNDAKTEYPGYNDLEIEELKKIAISKGISKKDLNGKAKKEVISMIRKAEKGSRIPGWYGTFPGASLDSATKTWDITERMVQGQFAAKDATWTMRTPASELKATAMEIKSWLKPGESMLFGIKDTWPNDTYPGETSAEFVRIAKSIGLYAGISGSKMYVKKPADAKDAKSESEWDLKFRLRHALPGETMSNKLGTVRSVLAREGFDRNFRSYGDRAFSATHSRMGFTVNIETEPTDDSRKVLKIRQVWFSDSKPTTDADMSFKLSNGESGTAKIAASAPAGYTYTNRTFNGYKIYKNGSNYVAVALHFDKPTYEGLANKINGDSLMNGANYRPALDAALTKDAAADGRETWKFDTMFMSLAEEVYNKLQMAGITSRASKSGQYYHIEAQVTPDEKKKIEMFLRRRTIHQVGGYPGNYTSPNR